MATNRLNLRRIQSKNNQTNWLGIVQSVLASAFGVQHSAKREQDFQAKSFVPYAVVGVIFVVVFVIGLALLVGVISG